MDKGLGNKRREYVTQEREFFFQTINLENFISRPPFNFEPRKKEDTAKAKFFSNNKQKIIVTKGQKFWIWSKPGEKGTGGTIEKLIREFLGTSDTKEVYNIMREYAEQFHAQEFKLFKERFEKIYSFDSANKEITPEQQNSTILKDAFQKEYPGPESIKYFDFTPASDIPFLENRGITKDTLENVLFKGRIGIAEGPFGVAPGEVKKPRFEKDELVFEAHVAIPYYDRDQKIVAIEVKNRLTDEGFTKNVQRIINSGEKISKARRNPALFYKDSNKEISLWSSNIPENPSKIFLTENAIDALSYYQISNDKERDKTIFMATGGVPTKLQLALVNSIIQTHNIKKVETGFDAEVAGLNYALLAVQASILIDQSKATYLLEFTKRGDIAFELKFKEREKQELSVPELITKINKLKTSITKNYQWEGITEFIPSLTPADGYIGTFILSYTRSNAQNVFDLMLDTIGGRSENFSFKVSPVSKDWNDQIQGIKYEVPAAEKLFIDQPEQHNRLFLTKDNKILYQRRIVNFDHNIREVVGDLDPFAYKNFVRRVKNLLPNGTLNNRIERFNKEYVENVPLVKENFITNALYQGIQFDNFQRTFLKDKHVIASIKDDNLVLSSEYKFSDREKLAVSWMKEALLMGANPDKPLMRLNYRKVFMGNLSNDNFHYLNATKEIAILNHPLASYANGVLTIFENRIRVSEDDRAVINQKLSLINDNRPANKLNDSIVFDPNTALFTKEVAIGKYINGKIEIQESFVLTERESKIIRRMEADLVLGRDPNYPGLLGSISSHLEFIEAPGVTANSLNPVRKLQLELLMLELETLKEKLSKFKELYTEPIHYYTSENLILFEDNNELLRYNHKSGSVEWTADSAELAKRSFNPYFFKALQLFTENNGVFHNYMRDIKEDQNENVIFYKSRDKEIGRIFEDDGKKYLALYPNIPLSMRKEIALFTPYPLANHEQVAKYNIILEPHGLASAIKEKKISKIPLTYSIFYNNDKLISYPEDVIRGWTKSKRDLFTEANLWNLSNIGAGSKSAAEKKSQIYERNGTIYLGSYNFGKYIPEKDILELNTNPSDRFKQQIAVIERNLVKDPANRKFTEYLFQAAEASGNKGLNVLDEEVESVLKRIHLDRESHELTFVTRENSVFRNFKIGELDGTQLKIQKDFADFSEAIVKALNTFVKLKNYSITFTDISIKEPPAMNFKIPEIPESRETYHHDLKLTEEGILEAVVMSQSFSKSTSLGDDGILFHFLPKAEQLPLTIPFNSDWDLAKDKAFWISKIPDKIDKIVVVQNPPQALLHYQYNIAEAVHERNLYLSFMNAPAKEIREYIEGTLTKFNSNRVEIVGEDQWREEIKKGLEQNATIAFKQTPFLTASMTINSVNKFLAPVEPDPIVEALINGLGKHHVFSPSVGVAIFQMTSETMATKAVVGKQIRYSSDEDAMWISKPLKDGERVILISNPEEALFYINLNKEFTQRDTIIAFQDKVTQAQVRRLTKELANPKFYNDKSSWRTKIHVVNTNNLKEKLDAAGFMISTKIEKPQKEITFKKEYALDIESFALATSQLRRFTQNKQEVNQGKYEAPVHAEYAQVQEHKTGIKF